MDSIGRTLKEKRETKRLTLQDVNSSTRVPMRYLAALEEDNISVFPAEVYFLGSLRKYALFLGLDANALVDLYKQEKTKKEKAVMPSKQESSSKPSFKFVGIFVLILAAVTLGVFLWLNNKVSEAPAISVHARPKPQPQPQVNKPVEKPAPVAPAKKIPAEIRKPANIAVAEKKPVNAAAQKGLKLEIEAVESSWVKVTSDDASVFTATLEKGQKKELFADGKFGLVVGYAPGIKVWLNGKEIDVKGAAKQDVSDMTLTAKDAR